MTYDPWSIPSPPQPVQLLVKELERFCREARDYARRTNAH